MAGVRTIAFIWFGVARASRIQPAAYLNRQQSSESQHNTQRHINVDLAHRDDPQRGYLDEQIDRHRKPTLSLASGITTDATNFSNASGHQDVAQATNILTIWDALQSRDMHKLTKGFSSLLENDSTMTMEEIPKRFWLLSVAIGFVSLLMCFCCVLGTTLLEASNSKGRNQYIHKGQLLYEWEQTPENVTLFTKAPEGVPKSDLDVSVYPRHLKIGRRGKPPFLKEELFGVVDSNQSTWDVNKEGELIICLHKGEERLEWPCVVLAHHPEKKRRKPCAPEPDTASFQQT